MKDGTEDGWGRFPRKVNSPRPLSEISPEWTQDDDDSLRDAVDPLRIARAFIWLLVLTLMTVGGLAVVAKVAVFLFAWVTS